MIGYHEWWGDRPRGGGKRVGRDRGGAGAIGRGRGRTRANAAQVSGIEGHQQNNVTEADKSGFPNLSGEQWTTLMNYLNTHKPGVTEKLTGKSYEWLLDIGASQHMTGDLSLLNDVKKIAPCLVGMPNGEYTTAVKKGSMCLGRNIYLNNVLFVPNMNCTLISVAQLVKQLNCIVTFSDKLCVIHDRPSRTLIGAGEQCEGVYLF